MFPLSAISNRRPFAPSALPEFIALMGASDFPTPPVPSSLCRLVRNCALTARASVGISMVTAHSQFKLDWACDPGWARRARQLTHAALLPADALKPSALSHEYCFGTASFTAALDRHSTSLAFLPTHQAPCYQSTSKAGYRACG